MKKKLLIVESPAKIKTISKFLGDDFRIMSTVGHIKDLPKKELGVSINGTIDIKYVAMENKDKVIADICKAASVSDQIFLAPDPDREGEIIAWHAEQEILKVVKDKNKIKRITFNEITKPAILEAVENPFDVDMKKVAAQQARRVLDRWVGYEVSPVLWKKIAKGLSAGRVQSVALKMICDRETTIREFKPEEYWSIAGQFEHQAGSITAMLSEINKKKIDIKSKEQSDKILKDIDKVDFSISEIKDKDRTRNPFAPFMTSTLQQAAFNSLGYTVKKTMTIAQKLYEGMPLQDENTPVALITYMRTDSKRISDTALTQTRSYIGKHFDKNYLPSKANLYAKDSKKTQDAHEAIRPIDVEITPSIAKMYLPKDAAKLYELIWRRFVACQMTPALYAQRQVVINGDKFTFKATGSTLLFDGFLKVYKPEESTASENPAEGSEDGEQKSTELPKNIKAQDSLDLAKIDPKQHFTQPPAKYTEGSLVKEMEKEGIGRPSTYATILSTIESRKYVTLDAKKKFTPTELGFTVTNMLTENLPKIMNIKFTALMEQDLDLVAKGEMERDTLLREFYDVFKVDLEKFAGKDGKGKDKKALQTEVLCPDCKKHHLSIRFGKTGEFLGCMGYPECKFTCNFERTEDGKIQCVETKEPEVLEEKCPQCGKNLREMRGRFGMFIACSGYPECKYIKKNYAKFKCPLDEGEVVEKKWRGGKMWGCANYPKCKFAIFGDIEETPCPQCKKFKFLVKKVNAKGEVTLMCYDKTCGYKIKKD
ncbi:MAG: topoisomerase protein [candidate division TM6 bacterium GW2011_GWF2_30_66]|nr:MAG: topoisomerase protein [candidate division TM6 bacterium GW2011_GWF2_30_66]